MDENKMFDLLEKIYVEVQSHGKRLDNVDNKLNALESEVKKNSLKLESIETKLNTIAEVQKSHMNQNEKAHKEVVKPLAEKVDVIELAVKDTSKDVKDIKEDLTSVELITAKNYTDIVKLKSVK